MDLKDILDVPNDIARDLGRLGSSGQRVIRQSGDILKEADKTRGKFGSARDGHYGNQEYYGSGARAEQNKARYYGASTDAEDARQQYENRQAGMPLQNQPQPGYAPTMQPYQAPGAYQEPNARGGAQQPGYQPAPQGLLDPANNLRDAAIAGAPYMGPMPLQAAAAPSLTPPPPPPPPSVATAAPAPSVAPASSVAASTKPALASNATATPAAKGELNALPAASDGQAHFYASKEAMPKIAPNQVEFLQRNLIAAGYGAQLATSKNPTGDDNMYGPRTHAMVVLVAASAGVRDVTQIDFTNPNDPETQKFNAALSQRVAQARGVAASPTPEKSTPATPSVAPASTEPAVPTGVASPATLQAAINTEGMPAVQHVPSVPSDPAMAAALQQATAQGAIATTVSGGQSVGEQGSPSSGRGTVGNVSLQVG